MSIFVHLFFFAIFFDFVWWEKIFSYICTVETLKTNKMKLYKFRNGRYIDLESDNCIYKQDGEWNVLKSCTGEILFSSSTLKECKKWQKAENEITTWESGYPYNPFFDI